MPVLTQPATPHYNDGADNIESMLIVSTGDILTSEQNNTFSVLDMLGEGTFAQVFKCATIPSPSSPTPPETIAIKICKNKPAFTRQSLVEVRMLKLVDDESIIKVRDSFFFKQHLCIVFDLMGPNLYEVLRERQFRGLSFPSLRAILKSILRSLVCLGEHNIVHGDIKPENILVVKHTNSDSENSDGGGNEYKVKLVDLGSSFFEGKSLNSYIQSRFYRAPEVMLGAFYDRQIDVWR